MKKYTFQNVTLVEGDVKFSTILDELRNLNDKINMKFSELEKKITDIKPVETPDGFISRKETAKLLGGISLVTLNTWTKQGVLNSKSIGGRVLYNKADVIKTLDQMDNK